MFKPSFLSDEYLVCDKGYVLSKTGKPLKPSINHHGYQIVNLMINGIRYIQSSIWRALNGLRKSYKGYYWQY